MLAFMIFLGFVSLKKSKLFLFKDHKLSLKRVRKLVSACLITSTLAASFLGFYYSVTNLCCLTSSCEVHSADCSIL